MNVLTMPSGHAMEESKFEQFQRKALIMQMFSRGEGYRTIGRAVGLADTTVRSIIDDDNARQERLKLKIGRQRISR